MTAPMVPPEVDLRDFAFMPLDVVRLRDSGLTAKATGDEFRSAVLLWCAAWHQVPAGSLPNDDDEIANICGYSRARREWAKVRAGAMRGWILCDDGRFYHAAVAAKALEAWIEKLASAIGGAVGNSKRWGVQIETGTLRSQFTHAVDCLRAIDAQSRTLKKKAVAILTMPSLPDSGTDSPPESPPESPPDRNRQGQGQGQGLGKEGGTADVPPLDLTPPVGGQPPEGRACRIPDGFPTPDAKAWARKERPDLAVDTVAEMFRDHWIAKPGKEGRKLDWVATWRNWVRGQKAMPRAVTAAAASTTRYD